MSSTEAGEPLGTIIDGVRLIERDLSRHPEELLVYRGETVSLGWTHASDQPETFEMPDFDQRVAVEPGGRVELRFKASEEGRYPIARHDARGQVDSTWRYVRAIPFQGSRAARFTEVTSRQARALIESDSVYVLDVRILREYEAGHLANATLIPVQELERRMGEIQAGKDDKILIYCRSGNRSTVAAQILMRHGYRDLYNLRRGIIEWVAEGFPIER